MADYYQQDFVSSVPLIALIREELSSYFNTGIISELLIPLYIDKCLHKLGRATYKLDDVLLPIYNSTAWLPEGFKWTREVWATSVIEETVPLYSAAMQYVAVKDCYCDSCGVDNTISALTREHRTLVLKTCKTCLLQPGNLQSKDCCKDYNFSSGGQNDKFDISGGKLTVEFEEGLVYMVFYREELTEEGYQLIPDDFIIQEYIEAEIKAKLFENISNSVTDETYNQVLQKMQYYRQVANEKLIDARTNIKKRTVKQTRDAILRNRNRMRKYNL